MEQSWFTSDSPPSIDELPTDEELDALALAADPSAPLNDDAPPYHFGVGFNPNALPSWYMPPPMGTRRGLGSKIAVTSVAAGMVVVCAFGLCITSGFLQWA